MAIIVRLGPRSYPIHLEHSYRSLPSHLKALDLPRRAVVVSHPQLLQRFGLELLPVLRRAGWEVAVQPIPAAESSKSLDVAQRIIRTTAQHAARHVPLLIAFGGGVVGDVTGFAAAIYRRGVPYIQLPTTLLAQVDSAIGGKVGVDASFGKNLLGAFHQPALVFSHLGLLRHLPIRQRRSGLSEIIKYGVIEDRMLFEFLERKLDACLAGSLAADRFMVERCARIKARVVSQDEREARGVRTVLNFGHTIGHALETATGYTKLTHGEAIAVGMACAGEMSRRLGLWSSRDQERLLELFERAGLPTTMRGVAPKLVERAVQHDKKFVDGRMRWVLPIRIGAVTVTTKVPASLVLETIRQRIGT